MASEKPKRIQWSLNLDLVFSNLATVFVVLKLTDTVSWPWIIVLTPLWVPVSIALVSYAIIGLAFLTGYADKKDIEE